MGGVRICGRANAAEATVAKTYRAGGSEPKRAAEKAAAGYILELIL